MTTAKHPVLDAPQAEYHPWATGTFDARPGLLRLGQPDRLGHVESNLFMLDGRLEKALSNKRALHHARAMHRHYVTAALSDDTRRALLSLVTRRLAEEWPTVFRWDEKTSTFDNTLLGWTARIDLASGAVEVVQRRDAPLSHLSDVTPLDAVDFLALNVPEDLAVWQRSPETNEEWLSLLHVSAPHYWEPREKIGRSFAAVHEPVADIDATTRAAPRLAKAAVEQGPFLRFAWGPAANDLPNHHPDAPHEGDRDASNVPDAALFERMFLRVERQTLCGMPEVNAALFTIRPYWYRLVDVAGNPERRRQLASALRSMSEAALHYKSLVTFRDPLVRWLEGP